MQVNITDLKRAVAGTKQQVVADEPLKLPDIQFAGPAHVEIRLTNAASRILVHGIVRGMVGRTCARCAEEFFAPLDISFDEEFLPQSSPEVAAEPDAVWSDLNVYDDEDNEIDLSEMLRQNILAANPIQPLCREDCRGLCPICGENKNQKDCGCRESTMDPRWQPLMDLQAKLNQTK